MNESAVQAIGSDELLVITAGFVIGVRQSATIDRTVRESIRVVVRWILKKYGNSSDPQEVATKLVLEQAEVLCAD